MDKFDKFMDTAEREARTQFEKETADLYTELEHHDGANRLVEALFSLRGLCEGREYEAKKILLDFNTRNPRLEASNSRYIKILDIMQPGETMRVPGAMMGIVSEAFFDINEDQGLTLIRMVCRDLYRHTNGRIEQMGNPYIVYRMNSQKWISQIEVLDYVKKKLNPPTCGKHVTDEIKNLRFTDMDQFVEFIRILADNSNYDETTHHRKLVGLIDILMKPEIHGKEENFIFKEYPLRRGDFDD